MNTVYLLRRLSACLSPGEIPDADLVVAIERSEINWPEICRLAGSHLVTPSLAGAMRRKGLFDRLPDEVQDYIGGIQNLNRLRNNILYDALCAVAERLNCVGIEPMVLKGAIALLPDQYVGAEDRMIGDLDLLVPSDRIKDAANEIRMLGYRQLASKWSLPGDEARSHHSAPLVHPDFPVKIELHRRILHFNQDNVLLMEGLEAKNLLLSNGAVISVPDVATRLLHNFLHAQIVDRQRRRRLINLRQLLEFAILVRHFSIVIDATAFLARLQLGRRRAFLEYLAQAERWFYIKYPETFSRASSACRELWFQERAQVSQVWAGMFSLYDALIDLSGRVHRIPLRLVQTPGWFFWKLELMRKGLVKCILA